MPLSCDVNASASSSASRKRSHAQITRSQSRSTSPQPSKRRRMSATSPTAIVAPPTHNPHSVLRYVGDGLDFRRPADSDMSGRHAGPIEQRTTIDLTLDDDSPPPTQQRGPRAASQTTSTRRAPPFPPVRPQMMPHTVVIDVSDDDDDDDEEEEDDDDEEEDDDNELDDDEDEDDEDEDEDVGPVLPRETPSPEVQIIGENRIRRPPSTRRIPQYPRNLERRLPSPPTMNHNHPFGSMAEFLRASTAALGMQVGHLGNHMNHLFNMAGRQVHHHHPILPFEGPEFEPMDINLDYQMNGLNGLNTGSDELEIVEDPDYKAPPVVADGFTRGWAEDDVLVCVKCGDELATGDNEIKQQVWVAKKCGHVYCGECAADRSTSRGGTDRTRKKGRQSHRYKVCQVEGCPATFGSPSQMFQMYL